MTNNIFSTLFLIATAAPILTSCAGSSSNPMEKYSALQGVPAPSAKTPAPVQPAPTVNEIAVEVFSIDLSGTSQKNNGNYIEGEEGQVLVRIVPKSPQITRFSVSLVDFSKTERPTLVPTSDPQIYALQWKPSLGIIPSGLSGAVLAAEIQAVVTEATDSRLVGLSRNESFSINVSRNMTQPKIIGKSNFPSQVEEGQTISFSIDIDDPSSAMSPRIPEILRTSYLYANTEAYRGDAMPYVFPDPNPHQTNPMRIKEGGGTKWRFFYILKVDQLPLDRDRNGVEIPSASEVELCFLIRAQSTIVTYSAQEQLCFKAKYAAQPPAVILNEQDLKEIKSGVETILTFKASTPNAASVVKTASQQVKCEPEVAGKTNAVTCTMKFTPTCSRTATSKKSINIKFDAVLNGKTKSTTLNKELTVLPNPEACPTPRSQQSQAASAPTQRRQGQ